MRSRIVLLTLFVGLCGCGGGKQAELAEVINIADEGMAVQLISGFYPVEQNGWRWTQAQFAVALKPPRRAASTGGVLTLQYSVPDAVLAQLKEITITAKVEGIPLPPEKVNKPGVQEMRRDIPASVFSGKSAVNVEFSVQPFTPPSEVDQRQLGIIVHSVGLLKRASSKARIR